MLWYAVSILGPNTMGSLSEVQQVLAVQAQQLPSSFTWAQVCILPDPALACITELGVEGPTRAHKL